MSDESGSEEESSSEDGSTSSEDGSSEGDWDSLGQSVDRAIDQQYRAMEDSTSFDDQWYDMAQTAFQDTVADGLAAAYNAYNSDSEDGSGSEEEASGSESGEESSDAENQIPGYQ